MSKSSKFAPQRSRSDLKQTTREVAPPHLPEEKSIRQELERFKSILLNRKSLSAEDWRLHDRLLEYYIQLKEGVGKPDTVHVPARSRWTKRFESYCLNSREATPDDLEKFLWGKAKNEILYVRELLDLAANNNSLSQEDIQAIIWNLHNKTLWENYPLALQRILLSVDPQASKRLPSRLSDAVEDEVRDIVRSQLGSNEVEDIISFVQGRYYDYKQIRAAIESRKSKYELTEADSVPQIPDAPLFAETKSHGFENQEITFYNPTDHEVVWDLSQYQLEPLRADVQPLAVIERQGSYSQALISDLERTLYKDMVRLGLGFTPVLNDLIDLFEASTGRDFFNDEWLSNEDRILSAMGVLAGSGQYYRYAKKVLKGPVSYVRDVQGKYRRLKNEASGRKLKELVEIADSKGIPEDWGAKPSKVKKGNKLQGFEYRHPDNKEIRIRVMPGDPNARHPNSRRPYVRQSVNNKDFDRHGRVVDAESEASHIPLEEYKFFEFWKTNEKK
jgi:hypothetical protein